MPEPFSINDMINNFQDNILPAIAPMMGGISEQVNIPVPEVNINNDAVAIVNNGQGYVDTGTNTNQQPPPQQPLPQVNLDFTPSSVPGYFLPNTTNYGAIPIAGTPLDAYGTVGYTLDQIQGLQGQAGVGQLRFDMHNGSGWQTVQQAAQAIATPQQVAQAIPGATGYVPQSPGEAIWAEQYRLALLGYDKDSPEQQALGAYAYAMQPPSFGSISPAPVQSFGDDGFGASQNVYGSILPSGSSGNFASTGNNIYGIHNYDDLDQRLLTGSYHGTPWYQVTGASPQYTPEEQRVIDKVNRWNALSPQEKLAKSSNPDWYPTTEEKAKALNSIRTLSYEEQNALKKFMYDQNIARGQALMDNAGSIYDLNYQVGLAMLNNSHASQISLLDPNSRVVVPEGNQLGRMLQATAHRGTEAPQILMDFANRNDAFADWWNPSGVWNGWVPSGSREGMGSYGTGSYFQGIPDVVFPDGGASYVPGSNYAGAGNYQDGRSIIGPVLPPGFNPPSSKPSTSGGSRIVTGEILGKDKGITYKGPGTGQPVADLSNPGNWGYPNDPTIFAPSPDGAPSPYTGSDSPFGGGWVPDGIQDMYADPSKFNGQRPTYPSFNDFFTLGNEAQNISNGMGMGTSLDNLAPNSPALNSHAGSLGGGIQNMGTGFAQGMFDAYYNYNGQGAGIYPATDVFGTTGYEPAANYVHYKR